MLYDYKLCFNYFTKKTKNSDKQTLSITKLGKSPLCVREPGAQNSSAQTADHTHRRFVRIPECVCVCLFVYCEFRVSLKKRELSDRNSQF